MIFHCKRLTSKQNNTGLGDQFQYLSALLIHSHIMRNLFIKIKVFWL